MTINISATLLPFIAKQIIGGPNAVIFSKKYYEEIEPDILDDIIMGRGIKLGIDQASPENDTTAEVIQYDRITNTLTLSGYMKSGTQKYMDLLKSLGWTLDEEAARLHGLPLSAEAEADFKKSLVAD